MRNKITFNDFILTFKDCLIITTSDIKKVFPNISSDSTHLWNKKKYITRIGKGIYFNSYFFKDKLSQDVLFLIANKAYSPSYISLESALSYYELIPEAVTNITSVTTKKTNTINYDLGQFIYQSIKPTLMFDFDIVKKNNFNYKIATPEKALADYFYLNPSIDNIDSFYELRINPLVFKELINPDTLLSVTKRFDTKSLTKRVLNFLKYITNDKSKQY